MSRPTEGEVNDAIDEWHDRTVDDGISLHDWLGWSWLEYAAFVESDVIPERPLANTPQQVDTEVRDG